MKEIEYKPFYYQTETVKFEKYLRQEYPSLTRELKAMSVRSGWFPIIDGFCREITNYMEGIYMQDNKSLRHPYPKLTYIGRYHFSLNLAMETPEKNENLPHINYIYGVQAAAHAISQRTCEICGKWGASNKDSLKNLVTTCEDCQSFQGS